MIISLGMLAILWRIVCALLLVLILTELKWAQKHNGETLRTLRAVFAACLFVFMFPLIAAIDHYTDISPGFAWMTIMENFVWIGYATLATCLVRFWLALHRLARNRKNGGTLQ